MGLAEGMGHAAAEAGEPGRRARPAPRDAIEVIETSGRPQETTQEKGSRSFSTLTAKPWVEMPRETCTPIEAIFRGPTHTPV